MTRVLDAGSLVSRAHVVPQGWEDIAGQPIMPVDSVERHRWLRAQSGVSDRHLAVTALAVLRDHSDDAIRLHTKAAGVLYRSAKQAIEAAVVRLIKTGGSAAPTREDAICRVYDVIAEAITKTTAVSGGEWVIYLTMRINGQIANYMVRDVPRDSKHVQLADDGPWDSFSETPGSPTPEVIERTVMTAIEAITTTDDQRCALEAMFAVGRFKGLPGNGTHTQAEAAALSGMSQQRISVLRRRLKAHLYESLGVPLDEED